MAQRIAERFDALPFDAIRVRRHIDQKDLKLGDFLQVYDRMIQAKYLARPVSREHLSRGDSETYIASDGSVCAWSVTAVVEEVTIIAVTIGRLGRSKSPASEYSIAWDRRGPPLPSEEKDPALVELFAAGDSKDAWLANHHYLDLWDWNVGQPIAASGSGHPCAGVSVIPHDEIAGTWLVETPHGAFTWAFAEGRNNTSNEVSPSFVRTLFFGESNPS